jgi:hypothetical protein
MAGGPSLACAARVAVPLVLAALTFAVALAPMPADAAKRPPGAIKPVAVKKAGKFTCAKVKSGWVPGEKLRGKLFLPHSEAAKNLRKAAKKAERKGNAKKAKKLARKAKRAKSLARKGKKACNVSPLRFNIRGAKALALRGKPQDQTRSLRRAEGDDEEGDTNLAAIDAGGTPTDAAVSGSAEIERMMVGPDGTTYLLVAGAGVNLDDTNETSGLCIFARVQADTGVPSCVDESLTRLFWSNRSPDFQAAVQFDASGAVYYRGIAGNHDVFRRAAPGSPPADAVPGYRTVLNNLVLPDGRVVFSAQRLADGQWGIYAMTASGSPASIVEVLPRQANWLYRFPDGQVYFGGWRPELFGVRRYDPATGTLDPKFWLAGTVNDIKPETHHDADEICEDPARSYDFCGNGGATVDDMLTMPNGKAYGLPDAPWGKVLTEYYPEVRFPETGLNALSAMRAVSEGRIAIVGTHKATNQKGMGLFNTATETTAPVNGVPSWLNIRNLTFAPGSNELLFTGFRPSDGVSFVGRVNLSTLQATLEPTGSTVWADLQALG